MGQVLHGSARTTGAIRQAIQLRQESVRAAAKRYGVSPTTIQKWRARQTLGDSRMGPKEPRSTVLSVEDEAVVVTFRRHPLLPLDDGLYGLQPTIPHLTRSSLHRCLERHGISRLPEIEGDKPVRKRFASDPIGTVTSTSPRSAPRRASSPCSWPSTARARSPSPRSSRAGARWKPRRTSRELIAVLPSRIHAVLTDNGVPFTPRRQDIWDSGHIVDRVCDEHGIEHRLTKVNHPWTNGQVERMNRTIKDATVKRYHDDGHEPLRAHLALFVDTDN